MTHTFLFAPMPRLDHPGLRVSATCPPWDDYELDLGVRGSGHFAGTLEELIGLLAWMRYAVRVVEDRGEKALAVSGGPQMLPALVHFDPLDHHYAVWTPAIGPNFRDDSYASELRCSCWAWCIAHNLVGRGLGAYKGSPSVAFATGTFL